MSSVGPNSTQGVAIDPRSLLDPKVWHRLALDMLRSHRPADALSPASNAATLAPLVAEHRLLLANVLESNGDVAPAIAQFELALQLSPADPRLLRGLAAALQRVGLTAEAARLYQSVIAENPRDVIALDGLASMRHRVGAEPSSHVLTLLRDAEKLLEMGRRIEALRVYLDCARQVPQSPRIYYWMGCVLHDLARAEAALAYYELAFRIDPSMLSAATNAAKMAASLGLVDRAAHHLEKAQRLRPDSGLSILSSLLIDAVYETDAHIVETRRRFDGALDRILDGPPEIADPLRELTAPTFFLAYHGRCNRELHTKLARAFLATNQNLTWTSPHCRVRRPRAARIKIGFISQFLRGHSIGKTTRGLVAQLSRERFEVYVIDIPPAVTDEMANWIRSRADHRIALANDLEQARAQIASLELDILFYQDIGLEPFSYFLACARLAPVQCVSFGHPDTTGIPNMDYFISSDLYELGDAAQHYSERLVRLHDLPTLAYYYRPERRTPHRTRTEFGLREGEHLYLCPQTLFKLHPDFDRLFGGILARDERGRVLLIAANCAEWSMRLQRRFVRQLGGLSDRIQFVPPLSFDDFLQLLSVVDVVLDTIHFNGMNTSLEAFSVGTPVITLPGQLQRSRHTQAMYRAMGIEDCVAGSEESYIDIAVGVATNQDKQRELRSLIMQRSDVLFEDPRVVSQFESFFERAHRDSA
jgi:predicted O-linked N-acetylglucosamine transferase (SPINDLY family)